MSEELSARLQQMKDAVGLPKECLERATYLHAMEREGLSTIERQSMETLYRAADLIASQAAIAAMAREPVAGPCEKCGFMPESSD